MFSAKPTFFPRFAINNVTDGGGRVNVTEPPTDKKNNGWEYLEKPARDYMNWIHRGNYLWIDYFNQFWNSSHQFVINEMTSESGNGIDILEPLGIKTVPVSGTNLHVNQADSAASIQRFTNSTTGATATDGFEIGIDASEQGRIWNYENTDLVIGTNNTARMYVKKDGKIGIGTNAPGGLVDISAVAGTTVNILNLFTPSMSNNQKNYLVLGMGSSGNDGFTLAYNHNSTDASRWLSLQPDEQAIGTYNFSLNALGYVGIGVVPALNPLHVQSTTTPQVRIGYDTGSYWTFGVADGGDLLLTAGEATGKIQISPGSSEPDLWLFSPTANSRFVLWSSDYEFGIFSHDGSNLNISTGGTNAGNIVIANTTECTGANTGALQVDGGVHVAKNLYAGFGRIISGRFVNAGPTITRGTIYTALSSYFHTIGEEKIISGGFMTTVNDVYIVSSGKRTTSTNIRLYTIEASGVAPGGINSFDFADGDASTIETMSISW